MADDDLEARLRDLKQRVEREPRSRFFVPLAEEYRKAGRLPEAIKALEDGLAAHPAYVAARVALARAFLEAGRIDESVDAFSKVLQDDPSNLVAAKALGDIHLSRGQPMDALKRYLRFRAVSGDRRLDEVIAKLREEIGPSPDAAPTPAPPPPVVPPPAFPPPAPMAPAEGPTESASVVNPLPPLQLWPEPPPRRETDPFDITSVPWSRPPKPEPGATAPEPAEQMLSRDVSLEGISSREASPGDGDAGARGLRLPEPTWPFLPSPEDEGTSSPEAAPLAGESGASSDGSGASGRTLAELYLEQGHHAEAIRLADELLVAIPGDEGLTRLRDEASLRLDAPAPVAPPAAAEQKQIAAPAPDAGREQRLAKIGILNQWLDAVTERNRP